MKPRDFTFGSDCWPGLAKFVEECGEALHEVGKLMGNIEDGILIENLEEELADVIAAARMVIRLNGALSGKGIEKRIKQKMERHTAKHEERFNGNVRKDHQGQRKPRRDKTDHVPPSVLAGNSQRADDSPGFQPKRKKQPGRSKPRPVD